MSDRFPLEYPGGESCSLSSSVVKRVTRPVRLLLLIPTLDRSGAEKQLTLLATQLPRAEFNVRVVALTRGGPYQAELEAAGVPVTVLGKRFKGDPWTFWRLRSLLKAWQPDVLHTWLFAANSYGRLAAGIIPKAKIIVSERCVDSWKSRWQLWLDRRLIPRTDTLVGNSQSVVDFYRELGVPAEKLVVIPNGVEPVTLPAIDRAARLKELGFPPDAWVAGYIGRLAPQKRVQDLIWTTETLRQIRPQLRFVIVGDGPERQRLEDYAASIHCAEHVRFVGHQSATAEWLALFNTFWLASDFEGMSNSLMEALSAGKPCLASDILPNRELITHGRTGLLIKPHDTVGFMQFTRELIDQPAFANQLGESARQSMHEHFSIARMVDAYRLLYLQEAGRNENLDGEPKPSLPTGKLN